MKKNVIGVMAHVDAGKTTLSEALLYFSGSIKNFGRVDHGTAFLDTFDMERKRGITIFSKQAILEYRDLRATLLDTPGHADFSAEMERTLDVLDAAILVISGSEVVQSHTVTVWRVLRQRKIPTIIFCNKMDLPDTSEEVVLKKLRRDLGEGFYSIEAPDYETMAMGAEDLLEEYLAEGSISEKSELRAFREGILFPVRFGAALKLEGVEAFLEDLRKYTPPADAESSFGAKVFKISRDEKNTRLTHMKITGGSLKVRETLQGNGWEAKVTQIRVYNGAKFTACEEALPGDVVALTGLSMTTPGLGLGAEATNGKPELVPVLNYSVILKPDMDVTVLLKQFREIEEEEPSLKVQWNERLSDLRVSIMGPVQLEILQQLMKDRFGACLEFGEGAILYRETITDAVEGVGHYEPLRHYAEVHLLLEPGEKGSGITVSTAVSEDRLDRNWQRLILSHIFEKEHLGVLTGSPITDINITLVAGRAHNKHTEGGDFRQATYRAIRQGLMQAESVLLEPCYRFSLELPQENLGRAMTDLQNMGAKTELPMSFGDRALIEGSAPVKKLQNYPESVAAYTHGLGRLNLAFGGYEPCSDAEAVIREADYSPVSDLENSPDSIFCSHGAGVNVSWDKVYQYMHLPLTLTEEDEEEEKELRAARYAQSLATDEELLRIFERTYGPVKRDRLMSLRKPSSGGSGKVKPASRSDKSEFTALPLNRVRMHKKKQGPEYLLVDGYNIVFAWDELKKLAADSLDHARERLIDILRNYQGFKETPVIVVFDAYKVKGNPGSVEKFGGLSVVYTREAETADNYIEKVTNEIGKKYPVRVATSDGLEQIIVLGHGALRISAREFREEVEEVNRAIREYLGD